MSQVKAKAKIVMPFVKITGVDPEKHKVNVQHNCVSWDDAALMITDGLKVCIGEARKKRKDQGRIVVPVRMVEPS